MVKVMVVISRKEGISREEFLHQWQRLHPPFVERLPGIRHYRQNVAIEHRKPWPFDGIAEMSFDSVADVKKAFSSPAAGELFAHEEAFLGRIEWFIAEETDVPLNVPAED